MRLRFRTLLLAVTLLLTNLLPASANLLDPFHWGNPHNGYGGYPAYDGGYAQHYGTYRLIDDWLGYGYLRNQEGTLGHYPYRGWNWSGLGGGSNWKGGWDLGLAGWNWDWGWGLNPGGIGWNYNWGGRLGLPHGGYGSQFYQPSYQGLLNPAPPMAPAYPAPIAQTPIIPQMPFAPSMSMGDPCCDPCCDPCMSMVQPQMPMPVTTWRPAVVDRGSWQRVWVPRPVTTMVPQTQYMMPQAPMMHMPMMQSGCDECGGSMQTMMHGEMTPQFSSDAGCCGSGESGNVIVPGETGAVMQQTMMMSPGFSTPYSSYPQYTMNQFPITQAIMNGWTPQGQWAAQPQWTPQAQWTPQTAYAPPGYTGNHNIRPRAMQRMARRSNLQYGMAPPYQQPAMGGYPVAAAPMQYGWQTAAAPGMGFPVAQSFGAYPTTAYAAPVYSMPSYGSIPMQTAWTASPMTTSTMTLPQGQFMTDPAMMNQMPVAGDIMGDHEVAAPTTAGIPVVPNSFRGPAPVMRANLARPMGSQSANRYQNVVR